MFLFTDSPTVVLRELSTEADDSAYFNSVEASRDHLSQFGDETAAKYPDLESVRAARTHPANPDKLRLGIWDDNTFVGSINLTPDPEGNAEIGYWLDVRYLGRGYATIATQSLAHYGARRYRNVYAIVAEGNLASEAVLERAGFHIRARNIGHTVFNLSGIDNPKTGSGNVKSETVASIAESQEELERFAELPNRRWAIKARDKNGVIVFLRAAVAKKLYNCYGCGHDISIGSEHVIMGRAQVARKYDHHHLDFDCTHSKILPNLYGLRSIDANKASASAINAISRK